MKGVKNNSIWLDAFFKLKKNKLAFTCLIIIIFYFAAGLLCALGVLFPHYALTNNDRSYLPPSPEDWFGTDIFGRDVLARSFHGIKISLTVGLAGTGLSVVIGSIFGAIAGYFGKVTDDLIVWLYTTLDTIPYILLLAGMSFVLGGGLGTLCFAIGITSWVNLCRLIRAEFMKHREKEYVHAATAIGSSHFRKIFVHIFPNVFHIIIINFSLGFIGAIKSEVILSYLGLGVEPGTPSWGLMITDARLELSRGVWWGLAAASALMFILVLAFNLFTDALREALDPKLRGKL